MLGTNKQENEKPKDAAIVKPSRVDTAPTKSSKPDVTAILLDAQRELNDMEDISAKTLVELRRQRELLHHSRQNLKTTQHHLHKSEGLITRMLKCWRG